MRNFFLTDSEIQDLINEAKAIDCSADSLLRGMKSKSGRGSSHQQNSLQFSRNNGEGEWLIYLRLNKENPFDFSCGLGFIPERRNRAFRLVRYNGKSHWHTNRLENESAFHDFHIHQATEKYQQSPYSDDHHARPTGLYTDFYGAFRRFLIDCKVVGNNSRYRQPSLFE